MFMRAHRALAVEVFCYAQRDMGFEFFWTDAESHPHLTTSSFVCCTLTTLTQWPAGERADFPPQNIRALNVRSLFNHTFLVKDAYHSPSLSKFLSAPHCSVLLYSCCRKGRALHVTSFLCLAQVTVVSTSGIMRLMFRFSSGNSSLPPQTALLKHSSGNKLNIYCSFKQEQAI